jgi:pyrroline-5-carboxylate reductase
MVTGGVESVEQNMITIFGGGVMGETLLSGLIRAGHNVSGLQIAERRMERAELLAERYGVSAVTNRAGAVSSATLILVVKPQDIDALLAEISDVIEDQALVISLAAGVRTSYLEARLPAGTAVVRVMPNTPALVDEGMSAVSPGSSCDADHLAQAEVLLAAVGRVLHVPEKQQDAVTAISGSGPAYIFFVVEAMVEAGVHLGLPRKTATELAIQTSVGAAKMLRETGEHPGVLREQVTSPAGTTAAALRKLEDNAVRAAFLSALTAARDRSIVLGEEN